MPFPPPPRGRLVVPLAAVALVCAAGQGAETVERLAPIQAVDDDGRVDPMRPVRLTDDERERLYEEAAREAEYLDRQSRQLRQLVRLVRPAVVHINARKPALRPRDGRASEDETGSGLITEIGGLTVVLTNRHVIDRTDLGNIQILLDDDRELRPRRLWADAGTDLAVMEIEARDLVPARLADDDAVEIGDTVLALGSPFGMAHSLTLGIVSATGRRALDLGERSVKFQDFIQTDAPINPGNSGGPLVNLRGEVVGINTCIASDSGIFEGLGFAIPVGMVTFVARQLVERGVVERGYLGVALEKNFTQDEAHRLGMVRPVGALITSVTPDSPASRSGMRRDDVVLEFDGRAVEDDDHLMSLVSTTPADRTVEIVIFRDRARLPLRLTVASRETFVAD